MDSIVETILKFDEDLAAKFGNDTKVSKIIVSARFYEKLQQEARMTARFPFHESFWVAPKTTTINTLRAEIQIVRDD